MTEFTVDTTARCQLVKITHDVQSAVTGAGLKDGLCIVFVPHTTAGITINENADPDVVFDIRSAFEKICPWDAGYRHGEGNAAAHVKASMTGSSVSIIVEDGRLRLGTWQGIFFCEFDGPRSRRVWVKTLPA
ncbi:MAG: secondary thiamine-phosphate synthase enzyme YjbQ [Chloroflexi bacterium]|nr:secondary thiamine-phosphate synthase enzyme YjbQ [Chloroflexota bacterium]